MTHFSNVTTPLRVSITDWPPLRLYLRDTGRRTYPVTELVYLQAVANYSWLNLNDGQRLLMPRTLKYYTPKVPSDWFVRLHRNCIVNRRYVDRIERTEAGGLVYLTNGEVLTVSRRRWTQVRRQFQQYDINVN
jgi:DNA-binding LytR/AlgR family response regulator